MEKITKLLFFIKVGTLAIKFFQGRYPAKFQAVSGEAAPGLVLEFS